MQTEPSIWKHEDIEIVQIVQDSFQEYDGYHSLVLFCYGCNLACPGCYNLDHVTNRNNIIGNATDLIDKYITPMHEAVVILGGEPTIWTNNLWSVLQYIKKKNLKTKVYTNGMLPKIVNSLSEKKLVDHWSIDLKCISNVWNTLGRNMSDNEYLTNIDKSIQAALINKIPIEIRSIAWSWLSIDNIKKYVSEKYPDINHIINEDFRATCEHFKEKKEKL